MGKLRDMLFRTPGGMAAKAVGATSKKEKEWVKDFKKGWRGEKDDKDKKKG